MKVQQWDMMAFLLSPRVQRAIDLVCYTAIVFDAWCVVQVVDWFVRSGK